MTPDALFERLIGVNVVLVGGLAAMSHGADYLTADVAFCYGPSQENRQRLVEALQPFAPYLRGVDRGLPFAWDSRTLRDTPLLTLATTAGDVNLMTSIPGVGGYAAVYE